MYTVTGTDWVETVISVQSFYFLLYCLYW